MRGLLIASAAAACIALATPGWSDPPVEPGTQAPPPGPLPIPPSPPEPKWTKWFNPETAPFIPVPLIA
ncbi:MAG TPA: hypothetical protein VGD54_10855, partial [Steroidobacteraceae bacterium]